MHPRLQRVLARRMAALAKSNRLQLFVSTHAPVLQDKRAWTPLQHDVAVFEAAGGVLHKVVHPQRLLDTLGIRGADVGQCNGVIWVEGPSDRLYIRHWLTLWMRAHGLPEFDEHTDYSFMYYGGAVLSHFSLQEEDELVTMLRLNRNAFVVMDRDDDFTREAGGGWRAVGTRGAKLRIADSLGGLNGANPSFWITPGYTIESSLPEQELPRRRGVVHRRGSGRTGGAKMRKAIAYCNTYQSFALCSQHPAEIGTLIEQLVKHIRRWCA